jgi:hypothetical protein
MRFNANLPPLQAGVKTRSNRLATVAVAAR